MNTPIQCPACGNSLKPEDRFCQACGKPVVALQGTPPPFPVVAPPPVVPPPVNFAPVPPPAPVAPAAAAAPVMPPSANPSPFPQTAGFPPAAPAAEQAISVIGMVRKKTGLFSSELYHMVITNQRLIFALQTKEMQNQDVKNARDQAKQQGKGFFGQVGAQMATRYGDKYMGISPHLVLAESPQNFAIPLVEVVKIATYHSDFEENEPDTMEVITNTQKLKFFISNAYNVEKQLKAVLGAKVR